MSLGLSGLRCVCIKRYRTPIKSNPNSFTITCTENFIQHVFYTDAVKERVHLINVITKSVPGLV